MDQAHVFHFKLEHVDPATGARAGTLTTPHGSIATPVFMPVGTQATVKTLTSDEVAGLGATIILGNTYHLYLRPGSDVIAELGGLHRFMSWPRALLTDSGGFQVFSLGATNVIDDEGVTFRSHIDGSLHRFTPERAIAVQEQIGADIIMAFDECAPYPTTYDYARRAMERTHRWLARCVAAKTRHDQALFGIVQGSVFPDLRRESAQFVAAQPVPGIAIGGLSVGESKAEMYETLALTTADLPADRPRYLMGVGSPEDLLHGVSRGVDMFDCVQPTRLGRHGAAWTPDGRINLLNARWARDPRPIQEDCDCYTCRRYSRAYLRHLLRAEEMLGARLATLHNVRFLVRLMEQARMAILENRFAAFRDAFLERFQPVPEAVRVAQRAAFGRRKERS
ncbi:tRNA guanosine(34) transglycosylase Tgt [Kallotenue papyrolyticum]|uniref:tRNA guanosine(34) transglycosylase Tgt n=1 Tax=Kallotenue papyrolyticum TaxID=1325125 RepID=UPI0004785A1E|nr:tRNA guanosine(34) transglycosylase Tgt [Kallotenue papyrolyticum]